LPKTSVVRIALGGIVALRVVAAAGDTSTSAPMESHVQWLSGVLQQVSAIPHGTQRLREDLRHRWWASGRLVSALLLSRRTLSQGRCDVRNAGRIDETLQRSR